jgi:predicted RNase H-like HicB family nuclease
MGHKPWDRAWKRAAKMRERRQWRMEVERDHLDGGWLAQCPDLPGCVSQGETEVEAFRNLADAMSEILSGHVVDPDRDA